jgi:secernin
MSNAITFGDRSTFDECSPNLISYAVQRGWCASSADFHMGRCYSGPSWHPQTMFDGAVRTFFARSKQRVCRAEELAGGCVKREGSQGIRVEDLFVLLRDHGSLSSAAAASSSTSTSSSSPAHGFTSVDICMHAGPGPIRVNQTTGSLVYVIPPDASDQVPVAFLTGTSLPCLSLFKPVWLLPGEDLHEMFTPSPAGLALSPAPESLDSVDGEKQETITRRLDCARTFSPRDLWWTHELTVRSMCRYYAALSPAFRHEQAALESEMLQEAEKLSRKNATQEDRIHLTSSCFQRALAHSLYWRSRAHALHLTQSSELSLAEEASWQNRNKRAGLSSREKEQEERCEYRKPKRFLLTLVLLTSAFAGWAAAGSLGWVRPVVKGGPATVSTVVATTALIVVGGSAAVLKAMCT